MRNRLTNRQRTLLVGAIAAACLALPAIAQTPVVLDSVVAAVNRRTILASDIDEEIRLSVLDPNGAGQTLTRQRALEQLIGRALIQQQIRAEDTQTAAPRPEEVAARLEEIRKELPVCVRANCASDAGWQAFLAAHDLTAQQVETNMALRLEILSFIEERFRPGIHITPQQIETYYRNTLLPQYPAGQAPPALEKVSPRIEEILLQMQVNVMFGEWLTNLRKQGDVEILDRSLEAPPDQTGAPAGPAGNAGKGSQ